MITATESPQWQRIDVASKTLEYYLAIHKLSQRQTAIQIGVPRTSLQHWIARKDGLNASPVLVDFFECPDGVAFLHRMVTAVHLEFGKNSPASIHSISRFLKLCGLHPFIATSYSFHRKVSKNMDLNIVQFGEAEQKRLAEGMPVKKITLCEDETFHPDICMVAIEPRANFIILEEYVENRAGITWNKVINEALRDLPVEVIQVTSDMATGLINHTTKGLNAHHSPDCFHVPHDIGKGTSGALAGATKKAEKLLETVARETQKKVNLKERYDTQPKRPRGRLNPKVNMVCIGCL